MRETFIDILHSRYYGNLQMFSPRTVALTSISITLSKRDIKSEKKRFDVSTIFLFFTHTHTRANILSPFRRGTAIHGFITG